jgi:hypothetical protein
VFCFGRCVCVRGELKLTYQQYYSMS